MLWGQVLAEGGLHDAVLALGRRGAGQGASQGGRRSGCVARDKACRRSEGASELAHVYCCEVPQRNLSGTETDSARRSVALASTQDNNNCCHLSRRTPQPVLGSRLAACSLDAGDRSDPMAYA